jgi:hypothetical protein
MENVGERSQEENVSLTVSVRLTDELSKQKMSGKENTRSSKSQKPKKM